MTLAAALVTIRVYARVRPMIDVQEESLGMGIDFVVSEVMCSGSAGLQFDTPVLRML